MGALTLALESCTTDDPRAGDRVDGGGRGAPTTSDATDDLDTSITTDAAADAGSRNRDGDAEPPFIEARQLCADASLACRPGYVCCAPCCLAGKDPVCVRSVNGQCPLPDLLVDPAGLLSSVQFETVEAGTCELAEGCLTGTGARRVMRFDVRIANMGEADLDLGLPEAGAPGFTYAACHQHHHFNEFASYTLKNDAGTTVLAGRKQAFCARDDQRLTVFASIAPKYDCTRQGISVGWADIYAATLPCQWLDITDVPPGRYQLEITVNPSRVMTEIDYTNNRISVPVNLP